MRVALTGATGFSGPHVLKALTDEGHDVVALARRPEAMSANSVRVVKGDLADEQAMAALVSGAEVVLHAAGATSAPNRAGFFQANLEGTRKLYAAARAAGARRFVYISSLAAREPSLSSYGASKAAAEHFLNGQSMGPEVLILRPPAIYGPGDRATLPLMKALQSKIAILPGRKDARFALIHVRDFGRVAASAVQSARTGLVELDDAQGAYDWASVAAASRRLTGMPERVFYIPKPIAFTAAAAMEAVSRLTGKPSLTNPGKVNELYHRDWTVQTESWPRPEAIALEVGLAETLTWYREQGWLPPLSQQTRSAP